MRTSWMWQIMEGNKHSVPSPWKCLLTSDIERQRPAISFANVMAPWFGSQLLTNADNYVYSSTAHFQHAVSTTLGKNIPDSPRLLTDDFEDPNGADRPPKRSYRCDHPNCCKIYRQLSGLRYHQLHVTISRTWPNLHLTSCHRAIRMIYQSNSKLYPQP